MSPFEGAARGHRPDRPRAIASTFGPWLAWAAGWAAMFGLDGQLDLANLAMLLVVSSALATLWLPGWISAAVSALAVAAFNWAFVPPRYTFTVDLRQHALLLVSMLAVNWIISALVLRQRHVAERARVAAEREQRLRVLGDTLREAVYPAAHLAAFAAMLGEESAAPVALAVPGGADAADGGEGADVADAAIGPRVVAGQPDADQRAGLALCVREGRPMGPGTMRYEEQPDWYLPLRGGGGNFGAALLAGMGSPRDAAALRMHLQALCDQMGAALQRRDSEARERASRDRAHRQSVSHAMLAAVSHDLRTPLASILGAASSLVEQADRLDVQQRRRMAAGIVDEVQHLSRLTDNALQLARLGHAESALRCDWESAEEIIGSLLRKRRRRDPGVPVRASLAPGLPLLWCDALLVAQLLDNLLDNAVRYSPADAPVELRVWQTRDSIVFAVRDRGPGIAAEWRERVFEVFQRGDPAQRTRDIERQRPGAGVGLAVCRAIARAHGGELTLRARRHGGCSFEFELPLREAPATP